ncbi:MAG: alpha/beta hydrolase [Bacteroidota bacterium]
MTLRSKIALLKLLLFIGFTPLLAEAQDTIALYNGSIPNSIRNKAPVKPPASGMIYSVSQPSLTIFMPEKEKSTGAAVIICPGGSYKVLVYEAEGLRTAKKFQERGIAAFVLKYRLPDDATMPDKKIGPLQDALQAIKIVREHAVQWGLDSNKIGIMGFSAGGHLAATAATHYQNSVIANPQKINLRPDFLILVYPVISMQAGLTHPDSRNNLLGNNPSREITDLFSNELQVNEKTPPTYITHAGDDQLVDTENSIRFYQQLRKNHVPAELHLYPTGGHGFVLHLPPADWLDPIFHWMVSSHLIAH